MIKFYLAQNKIYRYKKETFYSMIHEANRVWVESVGFISTSEHGDTQVEALMMEDGNFIQLMTRLN